MTFRLVAVLGNSLIAIVLFTWSLVDPKRRQTLICYAIWFELVSLVFVIGAIAIHTGAYPLWNNK
jgi:hypothetical protein